ncbi:putative Zinc finger protein ubi-d4 B [Hypsibius exemplaris]|uniref:Zinc finger protein ubi-d4 B n=1 Tax=Hypsibius exemplaris TaxID=2072580 RepID=A0A1W0X4R8_HYPEX|nr:putative Zinc finger protein ubi-d4 B [Hypsibius exemplaris]
MTEKVAMTYNEMLESVSSYNSRLLAGRRSRIPFHDPSTGVAFTDGRRVYSAKERRPGLERGQVYSYPSRAYKLRPRPPPPDPQLAPPVAVVAEGILPGGGGLYPSGNGQAPGIAGNFFVDPNAGMGIAMESDDASNSNTAFKESWSAPLYNNEMKHEQRAAVEQSQTTSFMTTDSSNGFGSDEEEFDDEQYAPRSSRKSAAPKEKNPLSKAGRARKNIDYTVLPGVEKKFSCNYCQSCYKTRPGLTYHVTKEHPSSQTTADAAPQGQVAPSKAVILSNPNADHTLQRDRDGRSLLCDICEIENPTVKQAPKGERLLSCSSCGHSAHPTCLNFSKNQRTSTQHYPWKCIECKSCSICNSAGNDEKLLFCDDCDRGYHMYCVKPPLQETPEGLWSCDGCLAHFGEEAAHRVWKRKVQQESIARYHMEEEAHRIHGASSSHHGGPARNHSS